MMTTKLLIAAFIAAGLAGTPLAAHGKRYKHVRHYVSTTQSYGSSGVVTTQPRTYGSSGSSVGTVTAPSVGSYYWPSVGVTNAVPTWSNTNPPLPR